jgi:hypothetical protein
MWRDGIFIEQGDYESDLIYCSECEVLFSGSPEMRIEQKTGGNPGEEFPIDVVIAKYACTNCGHTWEEVQG